MFALGIHDSAEYVRMAMRCSEDVHASTSMKVPIFKSPHLK